MSDTDAGRPDDSSQTSLELEALTVPASHRECHSHIPEGFTEFPSEAPNDGPVSMPTLGSGKGCKSGKMGKSDCAKCKVTRLYFRKQLDWAEEDCQKLRDENKLLQAEVTQRSKNAATANGMSIPFTL